MQLCIEREQIAGLYAMWARAKSPFEKRTLRLFSSATPPWLDRIVAEFDYWRPGRSGPPGRC